MTAILVLGGYGAFGAKVAERLAREADLYVVIAGRSAASARRASDELARFARARVSHAALDAKRPDIEALRGIAPGVIVNASGPFQAQDYTLARAAIAVGAHYVDLADARAFVTGIAALDADARRVNVLVASGASSVPAVATAIIDHHVPRFWQLKSIEHAITPGNGYDPGVATAASILGSVGKPMTVWRSGRWGTAYGWQGLERWQIRGLGRRLMSACDVPDLDLFPKRYAGVETVRFLAGLEVASFHLALWALSWPVRWGLVSSLAPLASALMWTKRRLSFLGGDAGGMSVHLSGTGLDGQPLRLVVDLVARQNHGPYVPALAAIILARKLARGTYSATGAGACLGHVTLAEIQAEAADLDIAITDAHPP